MPRALKPVLRVIAVALISLISLELALQLAFPLLPAPLIRRLPQYRLRMGFNLAAEHEVIEYPAQQPVEYRVTRDFGDLYRLTCLPRASAPPFEEYEVSFTRDAHGFRNAEPWRPDPEWVILGDSFTAAEAIAEPYWRGLADSMLILGAPGTGTIQQQRLFDAFVKPRPGQLVALAYFGGNDLNDNQTDMARDSAGLTPADSVWSERSPQEFSVVFHLLLYARDALAMPSGADCHYPQLAQTEPPAPVAFYDEHVLALIPDKPTMLASESWRITRDSIAGIAQSIAAGGARFLLMYIPQKAELYWHYLDAAAKRTLLTAADGSETVLEIDANLNVQRDLLRELAAELGIDFLDFSPALAAAISAGQSPYFYADTHWNQAGHDIARIALLDFINGTNLEA